MDLLRTRKTLSSSLDERFPFLLCIIVGQTGLSTKIFYFFHRGGLPKTARISNDVVSTV